MANPSATGPWIHAATLDDLCATARQGARLRRNLNLHAHADAPAQRLFNAIEPGSWVAPHRHADPQQDETMVALRGRLLVVLFDGDGRVEDVAVLEPAGAVVAVTIPAGVYHTVLALVSGTVFFEAKAGPYRPLAADDFAPWAPREGDPALAQWRDRLYALAPAAGPGTAGPSIF